MKAKKINKKFTLKKTTIVNLSQEQMNNVNGGEETWERHCLTDICESQLFHCPTEIYCTTEAPTCYC